MSELSVIDIEKTLAGLTGKREEIAAKAAEVAARRKALAFAVHAGDDDRASGRLAKVNVEAGDISAALEVVESAIAEGRQRLVAAQAAEAQRADREEPENDPAKH